MSNKSRNDRAMKRLFNLLILFAISLTTGCATFDDKVVSMFESMGCTWNYRRGQGQAKVINAPLDEVWNAAPRAMISLGFSNDFPVRSLSNGRGQLGADRPRNEFWGVDGPPVFIFVDREGESRTRVEVISKNPCAINITKWFSHDWGPEVMQKTEQMLLPGQQEKPRQSNPPPIAVPK